MLRRIQGISYTSWGLLLAVVCGVAHISTSYS